MSTKVSWFRRTLLLGIVRVAQTADVSFGSHGTASSICDEQYVNAASFRKTGFTTLMFEGLSDISSS